LDQHYYYNDLKDQKAPYSRACFPIKAFAMGDRVDTKGSVPFLVDLKIKVHGANNSFKSHG
jgi:hypothetical protein